MPGIAELLCRSTQRTVSIFAQSLLSRRRHASPDDAMRARRSNEEPTAITKAPAE